ncbi:MAG: hypothetical protein EAZ30_11480 [Betaproteobacteria bacterium]|nr:MAG: hypothetical protein EAZ30_11480 [Betaproteobacteria bacterium]
MVAGSGQIEAADHHLCEPRLRQRFWILKMAATKVILGDEFESTLQKQLNNAIQRLGGTTLRLDAGVAGSQDFVEWKVKILGCEITVENETYVGLSISGHGDVIDQILEAMNLAG